MSKVKFFFDEEIEIGKISRLWEKSFGRKFSAKSWDWFFRKNPFGDKIYVGYVLADDQLVSYSAFQPARMNLKGSGSINAGNMNMWMTHPDYQKKELLRQILKELFKELKKDRFDCLYSFPTRPVAWHVMKKYLDWNDVGKLIVLQYNGRPGMNIFPPGISFRCGKTDLQSIERTAGLLYTDKPVSIERTPEYLKWKLIDNPNHSYYHLDILNKDRLMAILFFKRYEKSVDIMEYFYSADISSERFPNLINGFNYLLAREGATNINMWSFEGSEGHVCLLNKGATVSDLFTHFGYVSLRATEQFKDISNWHLSFLDSDVY